MDIRVICGDYTPEGLPIALSKYERAKQLIEQGADAVFEMPVHCVLNSQDTFTFAKVAMVEKIRCSDIFHVYCNWEKPELLCNIALDIFKIERDRQRQIAQMKKDGMDKWEIRGILAQEKYPDTEALFSDEKNVTALEYLISHKSIYSGMKIQMHLEEDPTKPVVHADMSDKTKLESYHEALLDEFQKLLIPKGREAAIDYIMNIYGGMEENAILTYDFFQERFEGNADGRTYKLSDLTKRLGRFAKNDTDTRIWILRNLFVIRNIDNIIYGNNTYVPYGRMLAVKDDSVVNAFKGKSWLTILKTDSIDETPETIIGDFDDSKQVLFEIDKRAEKFLAG